MKKTFTSSRFYAAALSSMLGLSAFGADCVVNYTNFDTYVDTPTETTIDSVKQGGLLRAKIQTHGNSSFDSLLTNKRYTSVVGDPRTLSPYFMETESQNMIVTAGTITGNPVFMTYKVANLVPGSNVTLTFDAYSLLSPEKMENYLIELNKTSNELVRELKIGNVYFMMQSVGPNLSKGTGHINGNPAAMSVSTAISHGVTPSGDIANTKFDFGTKQTIILKSKVDENGEICFYFSSQVASTVPIGIDNIKVEGEAQPTIECSKRMPVCPASPVMFEVTNTLDSVSYNWSNGTETSNDKIFTTSFDKANETYTVKCTVEGSGCQATSSIEVQTIECCTSADGKPLDIIDVFFDDFGKFSSNGSEYTYISNGKKTTIPTTGIYGAGDNKRCVNALQEGASVPYITPCSEIASLNNAWAISNVNPYNPGVTSDASGNKNGGMLIVDLSGDKVNDKSFKDLVIYRHEANGNLKGKEISFGCKLGTINKATPAVGDLKVVLKNNDGITLFEEGVTLLGTSDWISVEGSFVSECDNIVFEIINVTEIYETSQGDFAIDDVFISYCDDQVEEVLPPISINYNTNADSINSLCKKDNLEIIIDLPKTPMYDFENLQYMLQYSFDTIHWNTLSRIQSDRLFVIDGEMNPCFTDSLIGKTVSFRVVAADYATLIGFDSGNLGTDKVSISNYIDVKANTNCNPTSVDEVVNSSAVVKTEYFNLAGKKINSNVKGIVIERQYLEDGSIINHKIIKE